MVAAVEIKSALYVKKRVVGQPNIPIVKQYKEQIDQQFEKDAARYISNFEGVESEDNDNDEDEDENEDNLVDQMEALIVNTNSDSEVSDDFRSSEAFSTKNWEVFSTSFGPFSHAKVLITDLAD